MQIRTILTILLISVVVSAFMTASWAVAAKSSKAKSNSIRVNIVPPKSGASSMTNTPRINPSTWQAQSPNINATTVTTCYPGWVTAGYAPAYSWNVPATAGADPRQSTRQPVQQQAPVGQVGPAGGGVPGTQPTGYTAPVYCYTCVPSAPQPSPAWNVPATAAGLPPAVPYTRAVQSQPAPRLSAPPAQGPAPVQQPQPSATAGACFDPVQWVGNWWRSVNTGDSCANYACLPACY